MNLVDIGFLIFGIVVVGGMFYLWYRLMRWIVKLFKKSGELQADSTESYNEKGKEAPALSGKFDALVEKLEVDRLAAKKKTKGLFRRSFLKTWGVIGGIFLILSLTLSEVEITAESFFVPLIPSAVIAALSAGIYTLFKKGSSRIDFVKKLKNELVSEIVKHINPDLTFSDEGITKEEFMRADLFRGRDVKSEDTIKGRIDGQNVIISECTNSSYSSSGRNSNSSGSTTTYFNGIFVILDLVHINVSSPIKIVPSRVSGGEFNETTGIRTRYKKMNIEDVDKIILDPSLKKSNYEIYCSDKQDADSFINETSLKVLDYIFDKYEKEKETLLKDIPFLKEFKIKSGVYISIVENKLHLAIDWNQDMFEPDMFLNKNLVESGIAQTIYKDLLFINQVVKEVNLLNKVDG